MQPTRNVQPLPSVSVRLLLCSIVIIGVGVLTATAHSLMQQRIQTQTDIKFAEVTDSYVQQLSQNIEGSGNLLYAIRGLFAAGDVDAAAWERFIQTQHSFERYPGMKVIGYAEVVTQQQKPAYIARLSRDLQLPAATIYPSKSAGDQVPLTYLQEAKTTMPRNAGLL